MPNRVYSVVGKRVLDLALLTVGLPVVLPVALVAAALVRTRLGRPVLYAQDRPGLNGKPFRMYKFRSMTDARDAAGDLLPDADRLTPFGRFLRSTSVDELPELWNVLRGEMSLVGPRPLLMRYLPRYSRDQARRHEVRPGITGSAQIGGRNALSWEDKFALDVWYVDHCSLSLDVSILLKTIGKVLLREGIRAANEATMPEFMGTGPVQARRRHSASNDRKR